MSEKEFLQAYRKLSELGLAHQLNKDTIYINRQQDVMG
jgi:hypothetical protein